jgi:uncharacterized protein (TIGR02284 family)
MTSTTTHLVEVLNDLIHINYDRIEGYRKAAEESKTYDIQLHSLFQRMADESRKNVSALTEKVKILGGEAESGSTTLGTIYHAWMKVKATFTGKDRASILSACEYGEGQAQKAYEDALASDAEIDAETRKIIISQKQTLKNSHDEIKKLRDVSEVH